MAQVVTRVNLSAATFPLLAENSGRSVFVKQTDQNYIPNIASKEDTDKDAGIPSIYYCHNVVPTQHGFQSVGYLDFVAAIPAETQMTQAFVVRDASENTALLGITSDGRCYALPYGDNVWSSTTTLVGIAGKQVTKAHVAGETYIYFSGIGCYKYNHGANTLDAVTLTGLTAADILGICAVGGYMMAWSVDSIAWSSLIDPTDFTPSLATGAGGGGVESAKGAITNCAPVTQGVIIFTTTNAVAGVSSGNSRYPFNFREIIGAGGLINLEQAAYDSNVGQLYAYTTSGMQGITLQQASQKLSEATDFLSGGHYEDFDTATNTFSYNDFSAASKKKLVTVANRYLIISYGVTSLTHALVYDMALLRWGKFKVDHVDCIEFLLYDQTSLETPKRSIGFLQADGKLKIVDFQVTSSALDGVLILGKYQYIRQRTLQMEEAHLENVRTGATFSCELMVNLDGKNADSVVSGYLAESSTNYRKYNFHNTAINHSLLLKGAFNICSVVLHHNVHGRR